MSTMAQKLKNLFSPFLKGRLLWRFLTTYVVLIIVMSIFLRTIQSQTLAIVEERTLDAVYSQQQVSAAMLEQELIAMLNVPPVMETSSQFVHLRLLSTSGPMNTSYYSDLRSVNTAFSSLTGGLSLTDGGFLYFLNNNSGTTSHAMFPDADGMFAQGRIYNIYYHDRDAGDMLELLHRDWPSISFLPSEKATVDNHFGSYVTVLVKPDLHSVIFGFLIREDTLLDLLYQDQSSDGYVRLLDSNGNVLAQTGEVPDDAGAMHTVSHTSERLGLTLENGVPDSYIQDIIEPLHASNLRNMVYVLLFSLVIALLLSLYNAWPAQKLARMIVRPEGSPTARNEYAIIQDGYLSAVAEMESLNSDILAREDALRLSLLTRLLTGGTLSPQEEELVLRLLPQLRSPYRVLVAEFCLEAESYVQNEYLSVRATGRLQELLPESFSCVQLDQTVTAFLLPAEHLDEETLATQLHSFAQTPEAYSLSPVFGLSDVHSYPGSLARAFSYSRARLLLPDSELFPDGGSGEAPLPLVANDLSKLVMLVQSADVSGINEFFEGLIGSMHAHYVSEDFWPLAYHSIAFSLRQAACKRMPASEMSPLPPYNNAKNPQRQFAGLQDAAVELAQHMQSIQDERISEFTEQIRAYIHEHFSDPLLDVDSIADAMHISRSMLYRQLKDTDMNSVAKYIHSVRMEKAMALLKQTDLSVSEIATACGYSLPTTFMRAFKKTYGIVPGSVRKNISE